MALSPRLLLQAVGYGHVQEAPVEDACVSVSCLAPQPLALHQTEPLQAGEQDTIGRAWPRVLGNADVPQTGPWALPGQTHISTCSLLDVSAFFYSKDNKTSYFFLTGSRLHVCQQKEVQKQNVPQVGSSMCL